MTLVESTNRVVANAIRAVANMPWRGNLYKCPYCGSTNGWTYKGICSKCGRSLPKDKLAKFADARIRRGLSYVLPRDIRGFVTRKGIGTFNLPTDTQRHIAEKHGEGLLRSLGTTIAAGEIGKTTVGSKIGGTPASLRMSAVRGKHVAFVEREKGGITVKTHFTSPAVAKREKIIHKETRRR